MKRGPKSASPETKNLHGSQRGDKPDERKKLESIMPLKPDWLTKIGAEQWDNIVEPLFLSGFVTGIDSNILGVYCDSLADYISITEKLESLRSNGTDEKTLVAWYKIKNRLFQSIAKLSAEFHLLPNDSGRVIIPLKEQTRAQKWLAKQNNA